VEADGAIKVSQQTAQRTMRDSGDLFLHAIL
jgi:hypothetical protein